MPIDFGFVLPAGPRKNEIHAWMDELDALLPTLPPYFKSLWMTDHFFHDDNPTFEAWTVIAYAAARWPRYEIGPMVLGQSYRNPALLAKMASTLQMLCRGRFIMAVGAGWKEDEYHAYGYPFPRAGIRVEQLEDTLEIITRMWMEPGKVSYQGKHYHIAEAYCEPKPDPLPTLIVGGGGNNVMMLAARFADWWNVPDKNVEAYRERMAVLHTHCATIGRDPASIRKTWFGRLAVAETEEKALALSNGKWTPERALVGTPEQVTEQIRGFVDLGVDYFMVEVLGAAHPATRALAFDAVLSKFA